MDAHSAQLALSLPLVAVTHFLGALAAYGSTMLALPVLVGVLGDLPLCVGLLRVTGTLQGAQVAAFTWRDTDWREYGWMVLWAGLGMVPGYAASQLLPRTPMLVALAVVLLVAGVTGIGRDEDSLRRLPAWLGVALLVVGGVIHGAFACGGATLVIYARHNLPRKEVFRSTLSLFWVTANLLPIVGWVRDGGVDARVLALLAWLAPTALVSAWAGERAAGRVSQAAFGRLVTVLLLVSGAVTLHKALTS